MNTRRPMENPPSPGDRAGWVRWRYAQNRTMLAEWAAAWAKIPSGVRAEITALHERYQYDCTGFNEGLWCCIDYLDGGAEQSYQAEIREAGKSKGESGP